MMGSDLQSYICISCYYVADNRLLIIFVRPLWQGEYVGGLGFLANWLVLSET